MGRDQNSARAALRFSQNRTRAAMGRDQNSARAALRLSQNRAIAAMGRDQNSARAALSRNQNFARAPLRQEPEFCQGSAQAGTRVLPGLHSGSHKAPSGQPILGEGLALTALCSSRIQAR
jgi:hypothetical protein